MKDLDLKIINGYLNIEMRTDGGIGIYIEADDGYTAQLDKEQLDKMMVWLGSDIRNAALEEAAKVCDKYESYGAAYEIRTMKK